MTAACIASARCGTVLELRPAMLILLQHAKTELLKRTFETVLAFFHKNTSRRRIIVEMQDEKCRTQHSGSGLNVKIGLVEVLKLIYWAH